MVNLIMDTAIESRASDIHIEPHENSLHIRNRIDGMLLEMMNMPGWMQNPITSRIKILASLDIAEKRTPQDGRIKRIVSGEEIDMRVSTLPTHHGEKTVIRLLRHSETLLQLESLGLDGKDLESVIELINKPQGMLFVTGPTGSGKSSTIFACLNRIKSKAINITTIEDPIEYKLQGINQVQINEKAGLTFADTLRSILRQDPDVILVGETRDAQTAQIALQSSQTGHLVFSTLHTNDSVSAITRLRDLGIPSFLVASAVLGVLAQRLVRIVCMECKEPYLPTEEVQYRFKTLMGSEVPFPASFHGKGCKKCNNTGFKGRTGVFEFLKIDNEFRDMIANNEPEHVIRKKALETGMKKLITHGMEKVSAGITSVEELLRVVLVE
jgi:type II secretory ATPase GspE/PulE/Tfp pilus assembly ATPase PilB-like protein